MNTKKVFLILSLIFSQNVFSQIPTTDVVNSINQLMQYAEQLEDSITQLEQYEEQIKQVKNMDEQLKAMSGIRDVAELLNSDEFASIRRDLPTDTLSVIDDLADGKVPETTSEYKATLSALYDAYPALSKEYEIENKEINERRIEIENREIASNVTVASSIHQSLKNTDKNISTMEQLILEIDKTEDLKGSIDLQSRMIGEVGLILIQQNRLMATVNMSSSNEELMNIEKRKIFLKLNTLKSGN